MDESIDANENFECTGAMTVASSSATPQSSFAVVKWRGAVVLIGLAPWVLWRGASFLPRDYWANLPTWFAAGTIFGLEIWSVVFPLAVAHQHAAWKLRWPRFGKVLREFGWAVPLTIGLVVLIALVKLGLYFGGGERAVMRDVFEDTRLSTELPVIYLLYLISACTLAPLGEEITMRGMVYHALKRWVPAPAALVMQAALFAVLHPQPLINIGVIFLIGAVIALIYEWRKTLLTPVLVHMLLNTLVITVLLIDISVNARSPILGVHGDGRPDAAGCVVTAIVPESAAAEAGLQVGDVIVGVDGVGVADYRHLIGLIRSRQVDQIVTIQFWRDGALHEVTARLGRRQ